MASKKVRRAQEKLNENGFFCGKEDGIAGPKFERALKDYKLAYAGAHPDVPYLKSTSGRLTPRTVKAMTTLPNLSKHFTTGEFRSNGDNSCKVHRTLLRGLEKLRRELGRPIRIVSGYRDPAYNASIPGAARSSQHMYGCAADLDYPCTLERARKLRVFSGLGHKGGKLRHVDVRHAGPNNTTNSTPSRPSIWEY